MRKNSDGRCLRLLSLVVLCIVAVGCLPAPGPETEPTGPITVPQASIRIQEKRSDNGKSYRTTHQWNGKKFDAHWELGSALKRTSKLQLKRMPMEWEIEDVKAAAQVVLDQRGPNPWYRAIEPTIFSLMDKALTEKSQAVDIAPQSPYKVAVKVNKHTAEWFVEVDVRIVDESGDNVGL